MRSMKKYIKYILFILIFISGDIFIGYVLSVFSKKQKYDNRIELILENKIEADVVIIGSSEALNDYSPEEIKLNTGLSCYNLGQSGSNPIFHETILDLVLKSAHKPKLVIYNVDDYAALYTKSGIIFRKDVLYPYVDNPFICKKINSELGKNELATSISYTYRQNVNFINALKYLLFGKEKPDARTTNINSFGATLVDKKGEDEHTVFEMNNINLSVLRMNLDYRNSILNIQKKCSENNIQLLFCLPPQFRKSTKGFKNRIQSVIDSTYQLIDYSNSLTEAAYFSDQEHLNKDGATYFSKLISADIKKIKI